jgi:hypothetical protein
MNTVIEKKVGDVTVFAIMLASEWYKGTKYGYPIRDDDFVVCKWSDYHDGVKSNIEGKTTIAICRELDDAKLIFNNRISN